MNFQPAPLVLFAVFASLSMNLVLHLGLGIRGIAVPQGTRQKPPFIKLGIMFTAVFLLWIIFSYIIAPLPLGFFAYILVFPLSFFTCSGLEYLLYRFILKKDREEHGLSDFYDGLPAAALFITLVVATGFAEAAILSFGFTAGILFVFVLVNEIRYRSLKEAVPPLLRGAPLSLITMGLLSLVFASAALMFFRALGGAQ